MDTIEELLRLPAPAPRPQSLAFDGQTLWMGSIMTQRIYAIEPHEWIARDEAQAPGNPWGMTVVGDDLYVLCGIPPNDSRVVKKLTPGHGFHDHDVFACPDDTGSQLSFDGDRLYISQWYKKRIVSVDERGNPGTIIALPHEICGQVIVDGRFYCLCTDDEESGEYFLTRVDARGAAPQIDDLARIDFDARALAWDGEKFWTNHREANEMVAFARPDAALTA